MENKKCKRGRPIGSRNKGEHYTGRVVIVMLESEKQLLKQLAKISGKNVSDYIRSKLFA